MLSVNTNVAKSSVINKPAFKGCPVGSREFVKCLAKEELCKEIATTPTLKAIAFHLVESATKFKSKMSNLLHRQSALKNLDKAEKLVRENQGVFKVERDGWGGAPGWTRISRNCGYKNSDRVCYFDNYGNLKAIKRYYEGFFLNYDTKGKYYISKLNRKSLPTTTEVQFKNFKEMLSYFRENLPKLKNNKDI